MSYRQIAGIGAVCLTIFLGVAQAQDIVILDYDIYPDPRDRQNANTDAIRALAASPDGKTLVCAGRGGFLFFDAETGKRLGGVPGKVEYGTGAQFAPDGKSLYTADAAGNLLRWDLDKRQIAFRFPQVHATIECIDLSADGSTLASTDGTYTVFWDARTGKFLHAWSPPPTQNEVYLWSGRGRGWGRIREAPERPPQTLRYHLALSPDGRWCAAGSTAQAFLVRAANADAAAHTWPADTVAAFDIAPDGKSYAVSTRGGIAIVASKTLKPLVGFKSPCSDCFVRFAPDGKTLIGYQPDVGVLAALDAATGKLRWQHQQAPVWRSTALAFIGTTQVVTGDSDRRLRVHDLAGGNLVRTIELPPEPKDKGKETRIALPRWMSVSDMSSIFMDPPQPAPIDSNHIRQRLGTPHLWHPSILHAGVFLQEGKELLVFPNRVAPIVFDTQAGKPIRRLDALHQAITQSFGAEQIVVSTDRRRVFLSASHHLWVWDLVRHRIEHKYEFPGPIVALAVARDGKRFAVAGQAEMHCPQPIFVGSTDAPELQSLQGHECPITHLAFSADGKRLFSASPMLTIQRSGGDRSTYFENTPGHIIEWDLPTGKAVRTHRHAANFVACSPDAKIWALQELNQVDCELFDWQQQKVVGRIESRAETLAFTPDGTALATGGVEQMIQLWDARTGKLLRKFGGHPEQGTAIVCFSADGRLLATQEMARNGSGAGSVRLWDVQSGKEVCINPGHRGPIQRVAYSPDGRLIVSAGEDRRILWWDAKTGKLIGASKAGPIEHVQPIKQIVFSADGRRLATASSNELIIWDVASRAPISQPIGKLPSEFSYVISSVGLSADGKEAVTVSAAASVDTWDAATGKKRAHFKVPQHDPDAERGVVHAVFSPDATHLAVYAPSANEILVFHVGHGRMVRCLAIAPPSDPETTVNGTSCLALVFSADGRYLAASVQSIWAPHNRWRRFEASPPPSSIHVWELAGGTKSTVIRDVPGAINTLAFSPDGRSLLHGISNGSGQSNSYYFAGDHFIAYGDNTSQAGVVLRDLSAGTELKMFVGAGPACVCMTTGWELPILPGRFQNSGCIALSPDGQSALSINSDRTLLTWNARNFAPVRPPSVKLTAAEQENAWADLALLDGKKAHLAIGQLTRDRQGTLAFLNSRLSLPVMPPAQRMQELIRALGSEQFTVRAAAMRELEQARELAEPALQEALAKERDPQRRRGLETLLARLADELRPECLRERRAVEVLERLESADAHAWLAELAGGPARARVTREAAAAMARLRMRSAN